MTVSVSEVDRTGAAFLFLPFIHRFSFCLVTQYIKNSWYPRSGLQKNEIVWATLWNLALLHNLLKYILILMSTIVSVKLL